MATTQESFDALLTWLEPNDREAAGRAYEVIRNGLIQALVSRGFSNAEDLSDTVIDRVSKRVPEIAPTYEGPPAKYFYGVMRKVIKEPSREVAVDELPVHLVKAERSSNAYDCLLLCLKLLPKKKSELILDYYVYRGSAKVSSHTQMASELGITENALRMQAYHIRHKLEKCVDQCLKKT